MAKIAGVDEAGRGCVLGPLVVAAVSFDEASMEELLQMGVKNSKFLTPNKRETLAAEILDLAEGVAYFDLKPWAIDKVVNRGIRLRRLNYLEAMVMAKVIRDLQPDKVFVDAADVVPERFKRYILRVLGWEPHLVCENKADTSYPVVSAASILAKVRRDNFIAQLREKHGDLGSGYPSDKRTICFLESWLQENGGFPPFVRGSWMTVKRMITAVNYDI
ncbi:MAG: ribonuclease HII [Candidatus Bathyarchaeota archaeon]|jgi:ribonuclease HII